ncbi:putative DsbA family dithiol-disulfide isomerase [Salsuginibacillus halophilus]|uniref:ClpXP adapter protein SpxH n=1 Tax=Salsuginibacillus halophilus TaxID=517424 RepID=A0A2P8HXF8_9BACI|nr:ClpXP adapter SpxH family protein [Salsuginibacillus halophilus]PSL50910.1 putative DsbA family dithiol-disulfide isomerase [Salsuginibacillus halophilus]
MTKDKTSLVCGPDDCSTETNTKHGRVELYVFTDPLCPECWAFEPVLKKLKMEYGHFITCRFFLTNSLTPSPVPEEDGGADQLKMLAHQWERTASRSGMSCDGDLWMEDPVSSTHIPSLAIKAAEMQGRCLSIKFFRRLRELLFLHKQNIEKEEVLLSCAAEVGLDQAEFYKDLYSDAAVKALQCDMKATKEMDVQKAPTFVFFNDDIEDAGLKISGLHNYNVYIQVLQEVLGFAPEPEEKHDLENFLQLYDFVATTEVAEVYDWSLKYAECRLKQLQLQRKVEQVPVKHGTFWRYNTH